jgi:hypothetical protein
MENTIPQGRHSYRTWRNSRWQTVRRMLLCLHIYYKYRDMQEAGQHGAKSTSEQRVWRLVSRPLYVCVLGGVMGKVMDLQKQFLPDLQNRLLLVREKDEGFSQAYI